MSGLFSSLAHWAVEIVHSFGYAGVFALTALGNLHLPIPSQLVLPSAGFLVQQGSLSFSATLAAATVAAVAAALIQYLPGFWLGEERLRRLVRRFGRFVCVKEADLQKAGRAFERHGGKAIVLGHLVPGVGGLISLPAGIKRMRLGRFMAYTALGSASWNTIFISLGWILGERWTVVERYASLVEHGVLAALAMGLLWLAWRRWKPRWQPEYTRLQQRVEALFRSRGLRIYHLFSTRRTRIVVLRLPVAA